MPRSGQVKRKKIIPDPIYESASVTRLINRLMRDGKKAIAQIQAYKTFELIKEKTNKEPLDVFLAALENIKPVMEVRSRRVGGAAYQVPVPVRTERRESLAIRWLILIARQRPNKEYHHFYEKLAAEIIDASNKEGGAIKKREEMHRMAESNKAFAHFRW